MAEFDITHNIGKILLDIEKLKRNIPKVTSRAMQLASEQARDDARKSAQLRMKDPKPSTLKAIRNSYPSRGAVIGGEAQASVHVAHFLVDELHPLVYDTVETRVPKGGKSVISPTKDFRTNKYGNIPGLRGGNNSLDRRRGQTSSGKFLDVPLGTRNIYYRHLPPGLYQLKGRGRNKKLVMIVSYRRRRKARAVWKEYPKVVRKSFEKNYIPLLSKGILREIGKSL